MKLIGGIDRNLHTSLHYKLRKKYGKANRCEHCNTKNAKSYQWALKKGHTYSDNKKDYFQLCTSCHRKYDFTESTREKFRKSKTGKFGSINNSAKPIIQLSRLGKKIKIYGSLTDAVKENNFKYANISMVLTGKNPTAYGYRWEYYEKKQSRNS